MTDEQIAAELLDIGKHLLQNGYEEAAGRIDEIRYEIRARSKPKPDCIRVKIAVAVDENESIAVYPLGPDDTEPYAMGQAIGLLGYSPVAQAFVLADIPETKTVSCKVVPMAD